MLWFELSSRGDPSDHEDEAAKLTCSGRQMKRFSRASGELVRDIGMDVTITIERNICGGIDREAHRTCSKGMSYEGMDGFRDRSISSLGSYLEGTFGIMIWLSNGVAKRPRLVLCLKEFAVVIAHVIRKV